jgi:hypothetical protein
MPNGDMITMGDQDDLDMAIMSVKSTARRERLDMGKMEVSDPYPFLPKLFSEKYRFGYKKYERQKEFTTLMNERFSLKISCRIYNALTYQRAIYAFNKGNGVPF